jgi:hypothetical protein
MNRKLTDRISFQRAMDNLALMASLDLENPSRIGIGENYQLVLESQENLSDSIQWLSGEGYGPIVDTLAISYQTVHKHLKSLVDHPEYDWKSDSFKNGISSMMALIEESLTRGEQYLASWFGPSVKGRIASREEYLELQAYCKEVVLKKMQIQELPADLIPQEAFASNRAELNDINVVKLDLAYELFYIRDEENRPYFTFDLLRNLRVNAGLNLAEVKFEEDPLLKIRMMQDRDLQCSAMQITRDCKRYIDEFFRLQKRLQGNSLAKDLSMAVFSLFLAANPKNLLQNTDGKSSFEYFKDFVFFLRACMKTDEYQKWIAYPLESSELVPKALLDLTHELCFAFFMHPGGIKQEAIGLIHRMMRRGEEAQKKNHQPLLKGSSFWDSLLLNDEKLRAFLGQFPNGPLFKILDLIREEKEGDIVIPFDPIGQQNFPQCLYKIERKGRDIQILHLPAPIEQSSIQKAEILTEFRGFLRALNKEGRDQKYLMVHLEDRGSWKEIARSRAIEKLQLQAEFMDHFYVMTLPKDTSFYHQIEEFAKLTEAGSFIQEFQNQLASPEKNGYFFPPGWKKERILEFASDALASIHEQFFDSRAELTTLERKNFIEIFYQELILEAIDYFQPDVMSFTCKDALDTGSAQSALFYGFLQMAQGGFSGPEASDFFLWLLYSPALFVRERAIHPERLYRVFTTLSQMTQD